MYNSDGTLKDEAYAENIPITANFGEDWELARMDELNLGNDFMFSDKSTGFDSSLYIKSTGSKKEYLYVTRGTDDGSDWVTNIIQGSPVSGILTSQYDQSIENAKKISNAVSSVGGVVFFTGHSLGGGLASANALATGNIAFTYNTAGLSDATIKNYGLDVTNANNLVNATINSEEILNYYSESIGQGAIGTKTILEGEDADEIRRYEKLAEEQFNKAKESTGDLQLLEAYGFLKKGLSEKKIEINARLDLHTIEEVIKLLGCDE